MAKFSELTALKDRYDAAKALLPLLGRKITAAEVDLLEGTDRNVKEYLAWETFALKKPDHIRIVTGLIEVEAQAAIAEAEAAFRALGVEIDTPEKEAAA